MNDLSRLENASSAVRRATENLVKAAQVTVTVIVLTIKQQQHCKKHNPFKNIYKSLIYKMLFSLHSWKINFSLY